MKRLLFIITVLVLPACSWAQAKLPKELVGIWATDASVLRDGKWLTSGQALYLGEDGVGAVVGGPPPIGVQATATFDATKNLLSMNLIEQGKVVHRLQISYDDKEKVLREDSRKPQSFKRRSEVFDATTRKGLGL